MQQSSSLGSLERDVMQKSLSLTHLHSDDFVGMDGISGMHRISNDGGLIAIIPTKINTIVAQKLLDFEVR